MRVVYKGGVKFVLLSIEEDSEGGPVGYGELDDPLSTYH